MGRGSIFLDAIRLPWWVGVACALSIFLALHGLLLFLPEGQLGQALKPAIQMFGYMLVGLFLLAALISFLSQIVQSKRYDTTQSLSDIRALSWRQFESYVAEAYRRLGYSVIETPGGPDDGVDLVLRRDGQKTYVQCKHWKATNVGVSVVRELLGSMAAGSAENGILVTSGHYTKAAEAFAKKNGIDLVDGKSLVALIGGVTDSKDRSPIRHVVPPGVTCPECGAEMVIRVAKRGANRGGKFWGCTQFPSCRGVRAIAAPDSHEGS